MRKVLYSPGYGAGWVSWHYGSHEQKLFMLEYEPFIQALENGWKPPRDHEESDPLVSAFVNAWERRFPGVHHPYLGGINQLKVEEVPDGSLVKISEYDGHETVHWSGEDEGWL